MLGRLNSTVWAVAAMGTILSGCAGNLKERELARVAKDWALTIRASQVIPVYPLTEDLQPGDVFLVRRPLQEQHEEYEERGFLQLDQHLTRLQGLDFPGMYAGSFGIGTAANTPHHWQFPPDGRTWPPSSARPSGGTPPEEPAERNASDGKKHRSETQWYLAPRAGFPTYTFHVKSSAGVSVAVPIQGVPVALGLMGADEATGSVTIADAYTYAVPYDRLVDEVRRWAETPSFVHLLHQVRRGVVEGESCWHRFVRWWTDDPPPTVYVRVIHRVYVAGRVVVELTNQESRAGKLTGGDEKPVDIPSITDKDIAANHAQALAKLSETIDNALPGGTLKVAWASSRSVGMSETFDRPLVVGFLGFDFPVLEDGRLGVPIATLDQLESGTLVPVTPLAAGLETALRREVVLLVQQDLEKAVPTDPHAKELIRRLDGLSAVLPAVYPVNVYVYPVGKLTADSVEYPNLSRVPKQARGNQLLACDSYQALNSYWSSIEWTFQALRDALENERLYVEGKDASMRVAELKRDLEEARRELDRLMRDIGNSDVVADALDYWLRELRKGS